MDLLLTHVMGPGAGDAVRRLKVSGTALGRLAEAKLLEASKELAIDLPKVRQ